jgi:hypothetical protein
MSVGRVQSRATSLPGLEESDPGGFEQRDTSRLKTNWIEITGIGEGYLSLARLSRAKYLALLVIGLLTALQSYGGNIFWFPLTR